MRSEPYNIGNLYNKEKRRFIKEGVSYFFNFQGVKLISYPWLILIKVLAAAAIIRAFCNSNSSPCLTQLPVYECFNCYRWSLGRGSRR